MSAVSRAFMAAILTMGGGTLGSGAKKFHMTENPPDGSYFDPKSYMRTALKLFDHLRSKLGLKLN